MTRLTPRLYPERRTAENGDLTRSFKLSHYRKPGQPRSGCRLPDKIANCFYARRNSASASGAFGATMKESAWRRRTIAVHSGKVQNPGPKSEQLRWETFSLACFD